MESFIPNIRKMGGVLKTQKVAYPSPLEREENQVDFTKLGFSGGGSTRTANFDQAPSSTSATQTSLLASVSSPLGRSRVAFTLAEVLITLGIIGIVAALTMPTLLLNFEKKTAATKAKKAYSELLQAIELSESHNGELREWTFPETSSVENTRKFVDEYIKPYFTDLKECSTGGSKNAKCGAWVSGHGVNYIVPNGTGIAILARQDHNIFIMVDVNGADAPQIQGRDQFYFNTANSTKTLKPEGWRNDITIEEVLAGYTFNNRFITCKKTKSADNEAELHRHGCTLLLMLKNWEIDSEYPW